MPKVINFLILFLLVSSVCYAEDFVCTENGKIVSYKKSIDPSVAPNNCTVITDVAATRSLVDNVNIKYLKMSNGSVAEMSAQEKSDVDSAIASANVTTTNTNIDNLLVDRVELVEAILYLIQQKASITITKAEIAQRIKDQRNA